MLGALPTFFLSLSLFLSSLSLSPLSSPSLLSTLLSSPSSPHLLSSPATRTTTKKKNRCRNLKSFEGTFSCKEHKVHFSWNPL
eukprot:m.138398 g.138398  ORF g.138398 m.138398 type:complete len:83 (-) comp24034_c0_seq11:16-264(-)